MTTHAKIQKWGNGLGLRISGIIRELPKFKEGTKVEIEVTENGFTVTKAEKCRQLPFTESELLDDLSLEKAHADLLASPLASEIE